MQRYGKAEVEGSVAFAETDDGQALFGDGQDLRPQLEGRHQMVLAGRRRHQRRHRLVQAMIVGQVAAGTHDEAYGLPSVVGGRPQDLGHPVEVLAAAGRHERSGGAQERAPPRQG